MTMSIPDVSGLSSRELRRLGKYCLNLANEHDYMESQSTQLSDLRWRATPIITAAASYHNIDPKWLIAQCRKVPVVAARSIAIYALREIFAMSYPQIGRILNHDHASCMHSEKQLRRRMAKYPEFAAAMQEFIQQNRATAESKEDAHL